MLEHSWWVQVHQVGFINVLIMAKSLLIIEQIFNKNSLKSKPQIIGEFGYAEYCWNSLIK